MKDIIITIAAASLFLGVMYNALPKHNGRYLTAKDAAFHAARIHHNHPGWNVQVRTVKATDSDGAYELYLKN